MNWWLTRFALGVILVTQGLCRISLSDDPSPYRFALSIDGVLERIRELRSISKDDSYEPSPSEREALKRLQAEDISTEHWADLFMIASGESDSLVRAKHVAELMKIADTLKSKWKDQSKLERGETILREMHATVMAGGYDKKQSNVAEVFRSHQFNCVSSSVLYFLMCHRVKCPIEMLEFPGNTFEDGHVMCLFLDGEKRVDVETTNADGFDIRKKIAAGGGFSFGIKKIEDGIKMGPVGLLISVYNNRAVAEAEKGNHYAALNLHWTKLSISPNSKRNQEELVGSLTNWTKKLADAGEYLSSIRVGEIGLQIAPEEGNLINNFKYAHEHEAKRWIAKGDDKKVAEFFEEADRRWPKLEFLQQMATAYRLEAQSALQGEAYDKAIAVLDRGVDVGKGTVQAELEKVRIDYFCEWSYSAFKKGEPNDAMKVLRLGLKRFPRNGALIDAVHYFAQEYFRNLVDGPVEPLEIAFQVLKRDFPEAEKIDEMAQSALLRVMRGAIAAGDFEKAHTFIQLRRKVLNPQVLEELESEIYDSRASSLMKKEDWKGAIKIYMDGLKQYPSSKQLLHNAPLLYNTWAEHSINKKDWQEAIRIYKLGLMQFPMDSLLKNNLEFCEQSAKEK